MLAKDRSKVAAKLMKLTKIAEDLRKGQHFSITRLTDIVHRPACAPEYRMVPASGWIPSPVCESMRSTIPRFQFREPCLRAMKRAMRSKTKRSMALKTFVEFPYRK